LKSIKTKLGRKLIQLGSWETSVNLDYIPAHLELDNSSSTIAVLCLWICSPGENSESFWDNHFFLVLIREEGSGCYERCGIGRVGFNHVQSSSDRPWLKKDEHEDFLYRAKKESPITKLFKNVEEQEFTLV
jgi:hypothetical protein